MKTKILIASLSLVAASAYAQPSIPAGGASPLVNRPEVSRPATPSMPQPAMQRPVPQPAVGATGGTGGNGGLLVGNGGTGGNGATPLPPTMPKGVGPTPLKNDDVGDAIIPPPHHPPLPHRPPSTPSMKRGDAQWWKEQAQSEAQVLEQKHQNDPFCMYDAYGIKQCL